MTSKVERYVLAPLIGAVGAVTLLALDSTNGLGRLVSLRDHAGQLEGRISDLEDERRVLASRIHALRSDPLAVERLAREKLGMVRPGEIVLRLPERPPSAD
jgi:cell division protein FtsB